MFVLIVILVSTLQVIVKCEKHFVNPVLPTYPQSKESVIYMLGSMTPYHAPKTCTDSKAFLVMRHGPKFPKSSVIADIKKLEDFQTHFKNLYLNNDEALNALPNESRIVINAIMNWENQTSDAQPKGNTEHGTLTIKKLGKRWNSRLKNIVVNIEKADIEFNSESAKRCVENGKDFLNEFLKINENSTVNNLPQVQIITDNRIKFDKDTFIQDDVSLNSTPSDDVEDVYYKNVCPDHNCELTTRIRELLFPNQSTEFEEWRAKITSGIVRTMYLACANSFVYNYSIESQGHAWCSLFNYEDLLMFERMHDIQYYIKNGYSSPKIMNFGHPMMRDILDFLRDTDSKKFKLFAAHTSNCLSLITGFRLFRDKETLTIKKMVENDKVNDRLWKSSFLGNYACNIMVVVYDCENAKNEKSQEVTIYLNENPLTIKLDDRVMCTQCPIYVVRDLLRILLNKTTPET
ncbi:multiple inositol polyphosphate phosphatase 1-like [Melanaphis sacchari]|uniref:Multiple inositol polyphosphate phosphatase 1 n=2 Tax=Melanaphis sacchari TaxID=742174 RepID=A0A2H8TWL7_9HEMI|nr:multiple inositol polyphosphate phosphatase 1-like [Melanaphis sacchari]XP_025191401.1 multiple inositol polyphosphate phosphatase 1-like [Melanaphis sacchari]